MQSPPTGLSLQRQFCGQETTYEPDPMGPVYLCSYGSCFFYSQCLNQSCFSKCLDWWLITQPPPDLPVLLADRKKKKTQRREPQTFSSKDWIAARLPPLFWLPAARLQIDFLNERQRFQLAECENILRFYPGLKITARSIDLQMVE